MRIVQRVIKFNQKGFAKDIYWYEYQAKKKAKNDFAKGFFNLMNNAVFGKNMENLRKNRNLSFWQQKKEETIEYKNEIIILQNVSQNIY